MSVGVQTLKVTNNALSTSDIEKKLLCHIRSHYRFFCDDGKTRNSGKGLWTPAH